MPEVLACLDFSAASPGVVAAAKAQAAASDRRIHLLHVAAPEPTLVGYDTDPLGAHTRDERAEELLDEHQELRDLAAEVEAEGFEVTPLVIMGPAIETILDEADRIDAGWIVVGSHGHGALHNLLVGSVSEGVLRHSTRPVLVVPPEGRHHHREG